MARSAKTAEAVQAWIVRQNSVACGAAAAIIVIGAPGAGAALVSIQRDKPLPIEQVLRDGPAHPSVLATSPGESVIAAIFDRTKIPCRRKCRPMFSKPPTKPRPIPTAANLAQPGARVVNIHYVLMQSYFEAKTADEARDLPGQERHPLHDRARRQRLASGFLPGDRPARLRPPQRHRIPRVS